MVGRLHPEQQVRGHAASRSGRASREATISIQPQPCRPLTASDGTSSLWPQFPHLLNSPAHNNSADLKGVFCVWVGFFFFFFFLGLNKLIRRKHMGVSVKGKHRVLAKVGKAKAIKGLEVVR